jgi:hypothetical protein
MNTYRDVPRLQILALTLLEIQPYAQCSVEERHFQEILDRARAAAIVIQKFFWRRIFLRIFPAPLCDFCRRRKTLNICELGEAKDSTCFNVCYHCTERFPNHSKRMRTCERDEESLHACVVHGDIPDGSVPPRTNTDN